MLSGLMSAPPERYPHGNDEIRVEAVMAMKTSQGQHSDHQPRFILFADAADTKS
jgi:hypothetical protein